MFRYMRRLNIFLIILILSFGCIGFHYLTKLKPLSLSTLLISSSTTTSSSAITSSSATSTPTTQPSKASPSASYIVVQMDDRVPHYKLATYNGGKPYANGDKAQATVIKYLNLVERCRADPSLIVVDVGGLLGNDTVISVFCGNI
jgi:hypothetical protein